MIPPAVVIGANYGDEGKGHVTDWLAEAHSLVVRFNGGAQAGHTVVTPGGKRHVFHHFGSGTYAGARTYLSRFFVVNPILFVQERDVLRDARLPHYPVVYVDPECPVTTPYDMLLNQEAEKARGKRHGSCGVGVNETITRHALEPYRLTYDELFNPKKFKAKLDKIRTEYVPMRADFLELKSPIPYLFDHGLEFAFLHDVEQMINSACTVVNFSQVTEGMSWDSVIFEGAQGLRLDEDAPGFPHVTRSKTGLTNVVTLLKETGKGEVDVYYVTRPYITRHGNGPLLHEVPTPPYPSIVDDTNVPHPYQGSMRYAWFDVNEFEQFVKQDVHDATERGMKVSARLVVTCTDHLAGENVRYKADNGWFNTDVRSFVEFLRLRVGFQKAHFADSPTRLAFSEM